MSKINGEKARASIAKRNRTARRAKDRERLEQIRGTSGEKATTPGKSKKPGA